MNYTSGIESSGQLLTDSSISSATAPAVPAATRTGSAASATSARSAAGDPGTSDSASVSLAGAMLAGASQESEVRLEKVAALRQAIEAGSYTVSSATVAGSLIHSLQG